MTVWIGYEAVILAGVTIGDGAVVGGVPAKPIRKRFPEETIAALLEVKWWDWPKERIADRIGAIQLGRVEELK